MDLKELFQKCVEENRGDTIKGAQQFIVAAKKEKPDVKMNECMTIAGFDKKTEQNFRNNVVIPVRNRIAHIKFNLGPDSIKKLFGRTEEALTDAEKTTKQGIQNYLPLRSRTVKQKDMPHVDQFLN